MSSLFPRGNKLYASVKDVAGKWRQLPTGFSLDQRPAAELWIKDREREVERERKRLAGEPIEDDLTVTQYAEQWGPRRRALGVDGNNDSRRLAVHVLPLIGDMPIASVEPKHLVATFHTIRTTPLEATGKPPAPRTVHHIYSAVTALFRDAAMDGKVKATPCCLTDHELGTKVDAVIGWRNAAVFTRDEAQTLISTGKIPWDRRVAYAIELLGGLRPGENATRRFCHYDPSLRPLGGLFVGDALNSKRGELKRTKTDTEKWIPVHTTLAAIVAEWKLHGWAEMIGRSPTPDDLIVPMPPADAAARTKRSESEPWRTTYYSARRWADDIAALGWRHRRHYDMRATFVTLALEDGADLDVIERRITHTKKTRSAFDGYNRGKQWARTCAELAMLKIFRVRDEETTPIALAASDEFRAVLMQSAKTAAMSAGSGLRRRGSKPRLEVVGATPCQQDRDDGDDRSASKGEDREATAQSLMQSRCDVGFALLR